MIRWEPKHRWEEVMEDLRDQILSGKLAPRSAIPPIPRIMQEYEIGRNTALHAVASLAAQGLVVVKRSKGTFVVPPEDRLEAAEGQAEG